MLLFHVVEVSLNYGRLKMLDYKELSDHNLILTGRKIITFERKSEACFLRFINEVERRGLHAAKGFSSCFSFLVDYMKISKSSAGRKIASARAALKWPEIFKLIEEGKIYCSTLAFMAGHLTSENAYEFLKAAEYKSLDEIRIYMAQKFPEKNTIKEVFRPVVVPKVSKVQPAAPGLKLDDAPKLVKNPKVELEQRFQLGFTIDKKCQKKLERVKELLKHKNPGAGLEDVFEELLDTYIAAKDPVVRAEKATQKKEKEKKKNPERSTLAEKNSRYISQKVKNYVVGRDGGRCTYHSKEGIRCSATGMLEYDHVVSYAKGGRSDDPENIRLRCKTHNIFTAKKEYGLEFMNAKMQSPPTSRLRQLS